MNLSEILYNLDTEYWFLHSIGIDSPDWPGWYYYKFPPSYVPPTIINWQYEI